MEALKILLKTYGDTKEFVTQTFYQGLCEKALERITELEAEVERQRWIPVSERLPELPSGLPNACSESVWLIFEGKPQMGYYTNFDGWRVYAIRFQKINQKDITHWIPIILPDQLDAKLKELPSPTDKCANCVYLEADGEIINAHIEKEIALEKIIDQLKTQHEEDENIYKQIAEHNDILIAENKKLLSGKRKP